MTEIEEIPLSAIGKVRRNELEEMVAEQVEIRASQRQTPAG